MENVNDVYLVRKKSQKEGKMPFYYYQMYLIYKNADDMDEKVIISMDCNTICAVADVTPRALSALIVDEPIKVAELHFKGE